MTRAASSIPLLRLRRDARRQAEHDSSEASCARPPLPPRPRTRGDCRFGARPCPWLSCRYHLAMEVTSAGTVRLPHPHASLAELEETCVLDVAELGARQLHHHRGPLGANSGGSHHWTTLERIGLLLNVTRERVRQIEVRALRKVAAALEALGHGREDLL